MNPNLVAPLAVLICLGLLSAWLFWMCRPIKPFCQCCGSTGESVEYWPQKRMNSESRWGATLCGECAYGGDCPAGKC